MMGPRASFIRLWALWGQGLGLRHLSISSTGHRVGETRNNMGEIQMHYAKWKKPDSKGYLLLDSIYVTFWKRQNYEIETDALPEAGVGGRSWLQRGMGRFLDVMELSYIYTVIKFT